jgi:predicted permease
MVSDLLIRLRALFRRKTVERELEDELRFHFEHQVEKLVQSGLPLAEARRQARLIFGGSEQIKEECRQARGIHILETLVQDVRYGIRMLYRNPGFTAVAVVALAFGIGINSAVFTVYKVIFNPFLQARDSGKMVNLGLILHSGVPRRGLSYPDYEAYRDNLHSFSGLIAETDDRLTLSGAGGIARHEDAAAGTLVRNAVPFAQSASDAEITSVSMVSENYFAVLGATAMRGRTFDAFSSSELAALHPVLVSENYWRRRFDGDPALLGKSIRLNDVAVTVIGITPHDFLGTKMIVPDFWVPLSLEPLIHTGDNLLQQREALSFSLYARLAPGVTMIQAQAEMNLLADRLRSLHDPRSELSKPVSAFVWEGTRFPLPLKYFRGPWLAFLLIMVAAGMVLVMACTNVAGLQLARTVSRQNELCMRLSLGASRSRLIRQLLTESALLGLLGGMVALLCTWALLERLAAVFAASLPVGWGVPAWHATPDLGIFGYVFAVSLVAGVLFGLTPALESSSSARSLAVKGSAETSPGRSRRFRDFLIAAQVSIALVFLLAGSMLIRTSLQLLHNNAGYDRKQVVDLLLLFSVGPKYSLDRKAAIVRELRTRIAAMPDVAAVTSAWLPDDSVLHRVNITLNGAEPSAENARAIFNYTYAQDSYFHTIGIPLLLGRNFQSQASRPEHSVILSESAAKQLWPGQNPVGRSLRLGRDDKSEDGLDKPTYQVVGIARDVPTDTFNGPSTALVYMPLPEERLRDFPILVRPYSDPAQFRNEIGSVISSIEPSLVAISSTLEEQHRNTAPVFVSGLLAAIASPIGLIGLLLAVMGIYGMVSHIVVMRTREIGIRIALGAQKRSIFVLIQRESMRPVLAGLLVGATLALSAFYLLRGILYALLTLDSVSFAGVAVAFLVIALLAASIPARRATRVDPMEALRCE